MFDKVLVLSASAGAGHVRAAEAVTKAFETLGAAREVRSVDVLQYTNRWFRWFYSRGYVGLVQKHPHLWGTVYDHTDVPGRYVSSRTTVERIFFRRLTRMLEAERPDLIVSTHFMPPEIVASLRDEGRITCPQAVVVTDLDIHGMWLCRHVDRYFVTLEETREHLAALGVPRERVTLSGIPIDAVFGETKSREAMCAKHGLRPDVTTLLVSAGGFGMGPVETMMRSLLTVERPMQVIAICGRGESLKRRLEKLAAGVGEDHPVRLKVVGFTREMDEFMSVSDVLVGKPGGLTTSEALAKGLAFVIVGPIPGQEERNTDHLLEEGVAIRCNNLPVLAWKIDRLLDDAERMKRMRADALRLARPHAARTIVETLLSRAFGTGLSRAFGTGLSLQQSE
ncbi:MAG TPA: glycosyltransferase [Planctomycetota bacterium]|nr:glycosyltransferase [Planctomycetota bacterium]